MRVVEQTETEFVLLTGTLTLSAGIGLMDFAAIEIKRL